jgi:hypothetical protein
MAKPKGSPKTGGRKKGVPNKATAELKALAQAWGPASITMAAELAGLVEGKKAAQSETARLVAIGLILDRGYGKATQTIAGDPDSPLKVGMTVDAPPGETREQWLERRRREMARSAA